MTSTDQITIGRNIDLTLAILRAVYRRRNRIEKRRASLARLKAVITRVVTLNIIRP